MSRGLTLGGTPLGVGGSPKSWIEAAHRSSKLFFIERLETICLFFRQVAYFLSRS
jgi:hypothetical protein